MSPWCYCAWSFRADAEVFVDAKLCCLGLAARRPGVGECWEQRKPEEV